MYSLNHYFIRVFILACVVIGMAVIGEGATFTVTKVDDFDDGVCNADCSLREAIAAAGREVSDDVIEFDPLVFSTPQSILLRDLGQFRFFPNVGSLTINGTGANKLTINGFLKTRVFYIHNNAIVTINDLTIADATGQSSDVVGSGGFGGAIRNNGGNLTLNRLVIRNSSATHGGGIYNFLRL